MKIACTLPGSTSVFRSCTSEPSPQSTMNAAPRARSSVHEMLRSRVGVPELVPSHVTARPVGRAHRWLGPKP
jgi:hypothetical protein